MTPQTDAWDEGKLLFGRMWEDPSAELRLLEELGGQARVMCVASAGDVAFRLAAEVAEEVDAVDLNPAQIHLCRLKQAMLEGLSYSEFADALGTDASLAADRVLPEVPNGTQAYWRRHRSKLGSGLHSSGRVDRMMNGFRRFFRLLVVPARRVDALLSEMSPVKQSEIFHSSWRSWLWDLGLRIGLSRSLLTLVYGRDMVSRLPEDYQQQMAARMEHFLTGSPAAINPFLRQTFGSAFPSVALPYMKRHGTVNFVCQDMTQFLAERPDRYDLLAFSNILEVSTSDEREQLFDSINRAAKPGAILCFRFMMGRPPITQRFQFDPELTVKCRDLDRAFFCNQFQIYRVKSACQ